MTLFHVCSERKDLKRNSLNQFTTGNSQSPSELKINAHHDTKKCTWSMLMHSNDLGYEAELIDTHPLNLRGIWIGVDRAIPHSIYVLY